MLIHKDESRGFTIVELLIVIVVIAILAAISIVAYNGIQTRAKYTKVQSDLKEMQKLIEIYHADKGYYPVSTSWSFSNSSPDGFIPGIVPDYASSLPRFTINTSSGNCSYIYRSTANGVDYKLDRLGQGGCLSSSEWSLVPASMKDSTYTDRYGYWSPGGASL